MTHSQGRRQSDYLHHDQPVIIHIVQTYQYRYPNTKRNTMNFWFNLLQNKVLLRGLED